MGAAPSREVLQRGLYMVRPPTGINFGGSKKQEIVLIPLTKDFFPSPDCPLFVQFHKARCDVAVNYYFRRPGNPGDLSRIPATEDNDDELSYPSRETLYRGVVERMEEMLFNTNEEMRQAYNNSNGGSVSSARSGGEKKRVLPILCAVAFCYDPVKLAQQCGSPGFTNFSHLNTLLEHGVSFGEYIVNIVGCFGLVPMEVDGVNVAVSGFCSANSRAEAAHSRESSSLTFWPEGPFSVEHGNCAVSAKSAPPFSHVQKHHEDLLFPSSSFNQNSFFPSCASTMGSSQKLTQFYDSCRRTNQRQQSRTFPPGSTLLTNGGGTNCDYFASLPPPVAAPLAAIVFLTKSAGEQNLSRVSFMAAYMYYNQLIDAGVLQPPVPQMSAFFSTGTKPHLPPLDTFSFSSLMTNVPILSFVHEMRCRWEGIKFLSQSSGTSQPKTGFSEEDSLFEFVDTTLAFLERTDIEMWITEDSMFHGRIGKELAESLCYCLAEHPEKMLQRVEPLPHANKHWRFRGLVDRNNPPPFPSSEGDSTHEDNVDVYVMGAAVIDGFDEGDVLRFDKERQSWVADRTIPLDTVVLEVMRPHCKIARAAPPDDPHWVTVEKEEDEGQCSSNPEDFGAPAVCVAGTWGGRKKKRVHVHKGNFYIYRFELNGKFYYHGTVPDFANPNKRGAQQSSHLLNTEINFDDFGKKALTSHKARQPGLRIEEKNNLALRGVSTPPIITALFSFVPADDIDDKKPASGMDYLPTRVTSATVDAARRLMETLFNYTMGTSTRSDTASSTPTLLAHSPPLGSPKTTTFLARRKSIVVPVGLDAGQRVPSKEETKENNGIVKRFVRGARYVWDWKRS